MQGFPVVSQSMTGRKSRVGIQSQLLALYTLSSGSGSITAPVNCWALIAVRGPGGSGRTGGGSANGGGGGGVVYKRIRLTAGQSLAYALGAPGAGQTSSDSPGNAGTDSTVTLPDGRVLRAGAGGGAESPVGGAGGIASGGDINVNGSAGGSPEGGAAGSIEAQIPGLVGGATGTTAAPAAGNSPGGGSRGDPTNTATGAGGAAQLIAVLVRAY
jgi:hypothetical protein